MLSASLAHAESLADLANDEKNTDDVLTYGMGYSQHRYSPLKQIDKRNVKRLVPVWSVSLSSNLGEQGQPLVHNGVLYAGNAEYTVARMGAQLANVPRGGSVWTFALMD